MEKGSAYNDCPIDPRSSLPDLKESYEEGNDNRTVPDERLLWPSAVVSYDGRQYLAVGHYSRTLGRQSSYEHEIYLVRDITGVYRGIAGLAVWFALIAAAAILICSVTITVLVRRTMRPLGALRKECRRAGGRTV